MELKSGLYFRGVLTGLDSYMNVVLTDLKFDDKEDYGHLKRLTEIFIRGDKIKFITYNNE